MINIIKNQSQVFDHLSLKDDLAYRWCVENDSVLNMQIVLRVYGLPHSWADAEKQLEVAKNF